MNFFKKTDLLIIAIIIIVSAVSFGLYRFFFAEVSTKAEIYYRSKLVESVRLDSGKEKHFSVSEVPEVTFHLYTDGTISFEKSDCPDQVCVNAGRIGTVGQFAACLPNEIILKIVSDDPKDPDAADIVTGN